MATGTNINRVDCIHHHPFVQRPVLWSVYFLCMHVMVSCSRVLSEDAWYKKKVAVHSHDCSKCGIYFVASSRCTITKPTALVLRSVVKRCKTQQNAHSMFNTQDLNFRFITRMICLHVIMCTCACVCVCLREGEREGWMVYCIITGLTVTILWVNM